MRGCVIEVNRLSVFYIHHLVGYFHGLLKTQKIIIRQIQPEIIVYLERLCGRVVEHKFQIQDVRVQETISVKTIQNVHIQPLLHTLFTIQYLCHEITGLHHFTEHALPDTHTFPSVTPLSIILGVLVILLLDELETARTRQELIYHILIFVQIRAYASVIAQIKCLHDLCVLYNALQHLDVRHVDIGIADDI